MKKIPRSLSHKDQLPLPQCLVKNTEKSRDIENTEKSQDIKNTEKSQDIRMYYVLVGILSTLEL